MPIMKPCPKHPEMGIIDLVEGCPLCIAERKAAEQASNQDPPVSIVKVRYIKRETGEPEGREYSYFTAEPLGLDFHVKAPVGGSGFVEAVVTALDVPDAEVAAFRDRVKTIPAGSIMVRPAPDNLFPEIETTEVKFEPVETHPVAQVASLFDPDDIQGRLVVDEKASAEAGTLVGDIAPNPNFQEEPAVGYPSALATIETQVGQSVPGLFTLYQEAAGLLQFAKTRVIATAEDLKPATNDLAIILTCRKAMEARKKEIVGPIRAKLDLVQSAFNDIMFPVKEADRLTKDQVAKFDAKQRAQAAEAKRIEEEKYRLAQEEAKLNGTGEITVPLGTAQAPPVQEVTRTNMGTLSGRSNWKARVVDFKALPDEYKLPNESMLNAYARTHKGEGEILGVEFYDDRNYSVRTKG